ncbi:MAG: hypothetical protein J6K73_16000 [Clostridia bacterium]|nr:hypothetical protein [Clostridia bacterium]MBP3651274.1 hypothetical protein [Clostridia bacterium]
MKQTVHPRGGWQQEENDLLFAAVREAAQEGKPLRDVFAKVGEELHRKPNSIRNYYYAKVKDEPELAPTKATFRAFDQEELHLLLRDVLMAKGRGESVRACVIRRANGDRSAMLRYQNKYRSILKNRPELLEEVAQELRQEGLPCPADVSACRRYSPIEPGAVFNRLPDGWEREPGVSTMLEGLCTLLRRMEAQAAALRERTEADMANGGHEYRQDDSVKDAAGFVHDELVEMPEVQDIASTDNSGMDIGSMDDVSADDGSANPMNQLEEMEAAEPSLSSQAQPNSAMQSSSATTSPMMQVPYDKWLKTRQEADRLRVEVDLLKIALEEAQQGQTETVQE